jgi:hypothetical protein
MLNVCPNCLTFVNEKLLCKSCNTKLSRSNILETPFNIKEILLKNKIMDDRNGSFYYGVLNDKNILLWLTDLSFQKPKEISKGEILPFLKGEYEEKFYMVWDFPNENIYTTKTKKNKELIKNWAGIISILKKRFLKSNYIEPYPFEIIFRNNELCIITGRCEMKEFKHIKGYFTPQEQYNNEKFTKKSFVYTSGAILYFLLTKTPPVGLLKNPGGEKTNLTELDLSLLKYLSFDSNNRPQFDNIVKIIENSINPYNPLDLFKKGFYAFSGLLLLIVLGYGLSVLMASFHQF